MVLRPATVFCFLLLVVALATSAKIPPKHNHRCSGIETNREKNARLDYLDFVPHSSELFVDDSLDDYLDDFVDDSLDRREEEEESDKNSKNLFEYLLSILSVGKQLEEMMDEKKIPSQEISIVPVADGSGEGPDDEDSSDEDPIEEIVIDEMHPVTTTTTTTTEPPKATENPLSGFCKSLGDGDYLNPFDCKTFINCFNGIAHILNCPTTSTSEQQTSWCDLNRKAQNLPPCN